MTCNDVQQRQLVEQYVHRRLAEVDRDAFEEHFLTCDRCFDRIQNYRALKQELSGRPQVATSPARAWWRGSAPVWVGAAAAATLVLAVATIRWTGSSIPRQAPATAALDVPAAPPPRQSTPVPAGPSRTELVAQLARFEPPPYLPSRLRGVEDEAAQRFARSMESYRKADYREAARGLRAALELNPGGAGVHFYLGVCELQAGRPAEATAAFQKSLSLADPVYEEDGRFFLSKAFLQQGKLDRAQEELQRVARLQGDREEEARALLIGIDGLPPR